MKITTTARGIPMKAAEKNPTDITLSIANAFRNKKSKKIGDTRTDGDNIWFHSSKIVRRNESGSISITTGDWPSKTLKERLSPFARVTVRAGQTYLNGVPWDGGWKVVENADGSLVKNPKSNISAKLKRNPSMDFHNIILYALVKNLDDLLRETRNGLINPCQIAYSVGQLNEAAKNLRGYAAQLDNANFTYKEFELCGRKFPSTGKGIQDLINLADKIYTEACYNGVKKFCKGRGNAIEWLI